MKRPVTLQDTREMTAEEYAEKTQELARLLVRFGCNEELSRNTTLTRLSHLGHTTLGWAVGTEALQYRKDQGMSYGMFTLILPGGSRIEQGEMSILSIWDEDDFTGDYQRTFFLIKLVSHLRVCVQNWLDLGLPQEEVPRIFKVRDTNC